MSETKELKKEWDVVSDKKPTLPHAALEEHTYQKLHEDINTGHYAGTYGSHHAAYHALAAIRAKVDMKEFHKKRSPDEFYVEALDSHLQRESTRRRWKHIATMDPLGMYSQPPTISATTANMDIPELKDTLDRDGEIVDQDGFIACVKCAVDYVWNIPAVAERLGMDESVMRQALADYTQNERLRDPQYKTYLPPVGGITVYFFGDITKLAYRSTEVALRCHDACCGSDVFGTDICTCRPYLIYAVQEAVKVAQRGGVGLIVYFQKEGRSLGEVTKFRVYNARKRQAGGDTAENYFYVTESIAGIRDARFQELMPDVLLWLGIERIDWLLSMSADKYDGITSMGIEVMQRVSLPDVWVPKGATVEISAKIASGYHSESVDSHKVIGDLRSLEMIRERCGQIYDLALQGKSHHFSVDLSKMDDVTDYVLKLTKQSYPDVSTIPYHSRWSQFDQKSVDEVRQLWKDEYGLDDKEVARRLIDLVTVSVLMDAGAGVQWKYIDANGKEQTRSEGLAIATMDMFKSGAFSSDISVPHRVNSHGLKALTQKQLATGMQVSSSNPMVGLEGRFGLLQRLGAALDAHPEYFGKEVARPGNVVDYLLRNAKDGRVSIRLLWRAVIEGLESIWPENHAGVRRGDVWVYTALKKVGQAASDMVPFHKLSQWLTYSLLAPLESVGLQFDDMNLMTGLAEYRNGGLFVDLGVISPKDSHAFEMEYDIGSELVVEWRALTVVLLDQLAASMRKKLNLTEEQLPLAKVLQGGSWAAGRIVANEKRHSRSSPITVRSDGTVF